MVTVKELKSRVRTHEHDFISSRTESESSLVCSTCGLLYCEKCGKLVNKTHTGMEKNKKVTERLICNGDI